VSRPPLDWREGLRHRLRDARHAAGLTCEQVTAALALSPTTVTAGEMGYTVPTVWTLARLAGLYGVSLDWLATGEGARGRGVP
jgi:transcriptional regulator with XRE-family HTH domain